MTRGPEEAKWGGNRMSMQCSRTQNASTHLQVCLQLLLVVHDPRQQFCAFRYGGEEERGGVGFLFTCVRGCWERLDEEHQGREVGFDEQGQSSLRLGDL